MFLVMLVFTVWVFTDSTPLYKNGSYPFDLRPLAYTIIAGTVGATTITIVRNQKIKRTNNVVYMINKK
jgi:hypothetical protein